MELMPKTAGEQVILGFGANLGDSLENIKKAIELIEKKDIEIERISSFYQTSPVGNPDQPDFINAALIGTTSARVHLIFAWCKEIERILGRDPEQPRWRPRQIDLDILFYGRHIIQTHDLIVPHPRFGDRLFAIMPAVEIAPEFMTPWNETISEFLTRRKSEFDFSAQNVEKL
jgi:2-amino-4-hydroxy-6-hydroxymethyldihydropteridine diphosphokinase